MQIFFERISDVIWPCFRFLKQTRHILAIIPNVFFNKNLLMKTGQIEIAHIVYLRFNIYDGTDNIILQIKSTNT